MKCQRGNPLSAPEGAGRPRGAPALAGASWSGWLVRASDCGSISRAGMRSTAPTGAAGHDGVRARSARVREARSEAVEALG